MFVKGHLIFDIDRFQLEYLHQNISLFGVMGLQWGPLDPGEHSGRSTVVTIKIPCTPPLVIQTPAYLVRESARSGTQTGLHAGTCAYARPSARVSESMGLKFQLGKENAGILSRHIAKYGFYPTEYVRKYPRIPSSTLIETFPLRVIVTPLIGETTSYALDIANLSPNGILLSSESVAAVALEPGLRVRLVIEPRGYFPVQVTVEGTICRVTEDRQPETDNLVRYFGIKFTRVDEVNRMAFLQMLKGILEKVKDLNQ